MVGNNRAACAHPLSTEHSKQLQQERVLVLTDHDLIEGNLFHHPDGRLSDTMNSQASRDQSYLSLVDVTVTRIATGEVVLQSHFVLVSRSKIVLIMPSSEAHHVVDSRNGAALTA